MKIYIETSVPNFLFTSQDTGERQDITRGFFKRIVPKHECFISDIYVLEVENATQKKQKQLLSIISTYGLKVLGKNNSVEELARAYGKRLKFPERYYNDLLHIAIATIHNMDVIVSWNLTHIVKLKTMLSVEEVNKRFKYK